MIEKVTDLSTICHIWLLLLLLLLNVFSGMMFTKTISCTEKSCFFTTFNGGCPWTGRTPQLLSKFIQQHKMHSLHPLFILPSHAHTHTNTSLSPTQKGLQENGSYSVKYITGPRQCAQALS